jgi:hypothetical protein
VKAPTARHRDLNVAIQISLGGAALETAVGVVVSTRAD